MKMNRSLPPTRSAMFYGVPQPERPPKTGIIKRELNRQERRIKKRMKK